LFLEVQTTLGERKEKKRKRKERERKISSKLEE
jgi:hypothetical protein